MFKWSSIKINYVSFLKICFIRVKWVRKLSLSDLLILWKEGIKKVFGSFVDLNVYSKWRKHHNLHGRVCLICQYFNVVKCRKRTSDGINWVWREFSVGTRPENMKAILLLTELSRSFDRFSKSQVELLHGRTKPLFKLKSVVNKAI